MSTATSITISAAATKAAKAIARDDISVWRAAITIGQELATVPTDKAARAEYWSALVGTLSYGPHRDYWSAHNASGRNRATIWATAFAKAEAEGFPMAEAIAASFPSQRTIQAFNSQAVRFDDLAEAILGGAAFTVPTVTKHSAIAKRGPKAAKGTKATKADKATAKAAKAVADEAKAEAKAIVATAKDDAKAVTLGRMVHFIAEQADAEMLAAIDKAVTQAKRRLAAAEAV